MSISIDDVPSMIKDIMKDKETLSKREMELKWASFMNTYPMTFFQLLECDDIEISIIVDMIKKIHQVEDGKLTNEQAEINIGEQLANKYLYNSFEKPSKDELDDALAKAKKNAKDRKNESPMKIEEVYQDSS